MTLQREFPYTHQAYHRPLPTDEWTEYDLPLHRAAIDAAAARISRHIRPTGPVRYRPDVWLKPESRQMAGSFKMRGALNALLRYAGRSTGVVAASSGNHARAVALAGRLLDLPVTVVLPANALPAKVAAVRALGADVVTEGVTFHNRDGLARTIAADLGRPFVHSSDDWDVIHGQGTVAAEVLADLPEVSTVVVPVGGGGLLAGTALAVKSLRPDVTVIGVEPERADDAHRSLATGVLQRLEAPADTVADGARVVSLGVRPFEIAVTRGLVDDIVTVGEEAILTALHRIRQDTPVPAEPTAALPMAALLEGRLPAAGPTVLVVSGGNVPPAGQPDDHSNPQEHQGGIRRDTA
ncbi:threonine/serine dehydratase [Streptomyces sp. NPDC090077]|uniref:threonine ammonia-lyase n=1 Tax=Streptomyces sp. NPDC090077 TaxID=3365938 RepID=UPI003811EB8D